MTTFAAVCSYPFRGFDAVVRGKHDTFSGVAKISAVGPDYRGPEAWVVLEANAVGAKTGASLPENLEENLAAWLKKNTKMSEQIDWMLKVALQSGKSS